MKRTDAEIALLELAFAHDARYGIEASAAERRALTNLRRENIDEAKRVFYLAQLWRLRAERRRPHEQRREQQRRARTPRRADLTEAIDRAKRQHPRASHGAIARHVLADLERRGVEKLPTERTIYRRLARR